MRMIIEDDLIIKCRSCNSINIIDSDSLDEETFSYERPMGEEIEHSFTGECQCTECGNKIEYFLKHRASKLCALKMPILCGF